MSHTPYPAPPPSVARDPTSFLANAADAYGSSRKAAPHVRRNYKTIWKAVKRYLKKPKKQR